MFGVHIEFLVEEQSAEAALQELVPRIVGREITFALHVFQGKHDKGYLRFMAPHQPALR